MKKIISYLLFAATLLLIIVFWWQVSGPLVINNTSGNLMIALGRLTGLLAAYFVLLQIVLIGRPRWLEPVFGLDRLARVHHLNGIFLIVFMVAHPVFLAFGYGQTGQTSFFGQLYDFLANWDDVFSAAAALIIFIFIVAYSIYLAKSKLKYEYWYFSHLFVYLAIAMAFGHQLEIGTDLKASFHFEVYWQLLYVFAFGNILLYRFIKPAWQYKKHRFTVEKVEQETKDIISVYITGNKIEKFQIRPGQFMIFRFLSSPFWWQAHPFSLSGKCANGSLRVSIKNLGDFTSQIAKLKPGTKVLIDGPLGAFTANKAKKDKFLLLAGGIGITPLHALSQQLSSEQKDAVLLYGNKTVGDIAFQNELINLKVKTVYLISRENNLPAGPFEAGRISAEKIQKLVPDYKEREVYLCGPDEMMMDVLKQLKGLGIPKKQIHYERFAY